MINLRPLEDVLLLSVRISTVRQPGCPQRTKTRPRALRARRTARKTTALFEYQRHCSNPKGCVFPIIERHRTHSTTHLCRHTTSLLAYSPPYPHRPRVLVPLLPCPHCRRVLVLQPHQPRRNETFEKQRHPPPDNPERTTEVWIVSRQNNGSVAMDCPGGGGCGDPRSPTLPAPPSLYPARILPPRPTLPAPPSRPSYPARTAVASLFWRPISLGVTKPGTCRHHFLPTIPKHFVQHFVQNTHQDTGVYPKTLRP